MAHHKPKSVSDHSNSMKLLLNYIILHVIHNISMGKGNVSELLPPVNVLNVQCLCASRVFSFLVRSPGRAQACCIDGRSLWVTTSQWQGESTHGQQVRSHVSRYHSNVNCCFSHMLQTRQLSENIWSTWTQVRWAQPSRVGLDAQPSALKFNDSTEFPLNLVHLHSGAVWEWTGTKTGTSWQRSQLNPAPSISGTPALTKLPR